MEKELLKVIKENLPEQTVGVLKEQLESIEQLKEREISHKKLVEALDKTIYDLHDEIRILRVDLEKLSELKLREEDVRKRELELEKDKAIDKATNAVEKVDLMKDIMAMVFKSPVYRKNIANDIVTNYDTNTGQSKMIPGGPISIEETID